MNSQPNQKQSATQSNSLSDNELTKSFALSRPEISKINKAINAADELIAALQNHRENRRARQVFEWEATRRETLNYI